MGDASVPMSVNAMRYLTTCTTYVTVTLQRFRASIEIAPWLLRQISAARHVLPGLQPPEDSLSDSLDAVVGITPKHNHTRDLPSCGSALAADDINDDLSTFLRVAGLLAVDGCL